MQHGLNGSSALDGLCCWSYAHDTRGRSRTVKGVSLVGSHTRRDGWMQRTALCADKIAAILMRSFSSNAFPFIGAPPLMPKALGGARRRLTRQGIRSITSLSLL